ncbi:hypothetical protein ZWY2020_000409 [Hordeum vulgare]|nr:hypothetical protein ZWY2020_000409 [Hordeum vulgare]
MQSAAVSSLPSLPLLLLPAARPPPPSLPSPSSSLRRLRPRGQSIEEGPPGCVLRVCHSFTGAASVLPSVSIRDYRKHALLSVEDNSLAFELLVADERLRIQIYSSRKGRWGPVRAALPRRQSRPFHDSYPLVIGRTVHWLCKPEPPLPLRYLSGPEPYIVAVDADTMEASVIDLSRGCTSRMTASMSTTTPLAWISMEMGARSTTSGAARGRRSHAWCRCQRSTSCLLHGRRGRRRFGMGMLDILGCQAMPRTTVGFDTANDGVLYTASSDGTISNTDLDTRIGSPLLNLNPDGWSGPSTWRMIYGMDLNTDKGLLLMADSFGFLYLLDRRSTERIGQPIICYIFALFLGRDNI